MHLSRRILPTLVVSLVVLSGCGYHFSGEGPTPRPGLSRIAIPVFENDSGVPEAGSLFAGALRKEFLTKGHLDVVPVDQAEAIFKGRIVNVYTAAVAHRAAQQTVLTRLNVVLNIRCVDAKTGAIIWQDPSFTFYEDYEDSLNPTAPDPIATYDNRRQALTFIAEQMASRIHDRFMTAF
jgi:hypothetical protein